MYHPQQYGGYGSYPPPQQGYYGYNPPPPANYGKNAIKIKNKFFDIEICVDKNKN
jgi:hypothetical protein